MTNVNIDGQLVAKICKDLSPDNDDKALLEKIQSLIPDYPVHLAKTGENWYRLGGVVTAEGERIASDLTEWAERTFIECGKNLQTLIEHSLELQLLASRQIGNTLYFVVETGDDAEQFIQIDIDKTHEIADRLMVSEKNPPEDLEEFIDPLESEAVEAFCIGTSRYTYRRKTDVAVFMEEISIHYQDEHPVLRFMKDWNNSSARLSRKLCHDWIIRPNRHTGRFGEQNINVEIINVQKKNILALDDFAGKKGTALQTILTRFDRQAGYPFAWFFYMLKGKLVSERTGLAVYKDINYDYAYLPERDIAIIKQWIDTPYKV
jgi:hypothetical protein